jgi:hypothetical protein
LCPSFPFLSFFLFLFFFLFSSVKPSVKTEIKHQLQKVKTMADQDQDQDQEKKKRTLVSDECADSDAPPNKKHRGESFIPSAVDFLALRMETLLSETLEPLIKKGVRVASLEILPVKVDKMDDLNNLVRAPKVAYKSVAVGAFPTNEPGLIKFALDGVFEVSFNFGTWEDVQKAFGDILPRLKSENFKPEENPFHKRFLKEITEVFDRVETRLGAIQTFDHSVGQNEEGFQKILDLLSELQESALREGVILGRFNPAYPIQQGSGGAPYPGWPCEPHYSPVHSPRYSDE